MFYLISATDFRTFVVLLQKKGEFMNYTAYKNVRGINPFNPLFI